MVRRVGNGGAAIDVGGKDQVMDGDAVVIHQNALDIVRAAGGDAVEHVGDVGGDGGEVVEILEPRICSISSVNTRSKNRSQFWKPMVQMGMTVQPSLKCSSVTKFSVTLVMAEITRSEPPMTSS